MVKLRLSIADLRGKQKLLKVSALILLQISVHNPQASSEVRAAGFYITMSNNITHPDSHGVWVCHLKMVNWKWLIEERHVVLKGYMICLAGLQVFHFWNHSNALSTYMHFQLLEYNLINLSSLERKKQLVQVEMSCRKSKKPLWASSQW